MGDNVNLYQEKLDKIIQMLSAASNEIENVLLSSTHIVEHNRLLKSTLDIQMVLDNTIQEVRAVSQELKPMILQNSGLGEALKDLCDQAGDEGEVGISYRNSIGNLRMEGKVERIVYKIAQEAVSNVLKHARAKKALVSINIKDDIIILQVIDDGVGYDSSANWTKEGTGLNTMEEGTKSLYGSLKCLSASGEGTHIRMSFKMEK